MLQEKSQAKCRVAYAVIVGLLVLGFACPASAAPLDLASQLFNTGVNGDGTVGPIGALEPHYSLITVAGGNPIAYVLPANPSWLANSSTSSWIGPEGANLTRYAPGDYWYRYRIDLTGYDLSSVVIKGQWTSDNGAYIKVNDLITANTVPAYQGFKQMHAFNLSSGWKQGINEIYFVVNNTEPTTSPTGLRVEFDLAGSGGGEQGVLPVPEPGLLQMGALVLMSGVGLFRSRFGRA